MTCLRTLLIVFLLLAPASVSAEGPWIDRQFMPRADATLKVGTEEVSPETVRLPYRVTNVNGDWLWIGKAWVKKRHVVPIDEAVDYYTSFLRTHPNSSWGYTIRGIAKEHHYDPEFDAGDYSFDSIDADYSRAIRLDPSNEWAYYCRGMLRSSYDHLYGGVFWGGKDVLQEGINDLTQALRVNPRYAPAYQFRGDIYSWDGSDSWKPDWNRALADYSNAVQFSSTTEDEIEARLSRSNALISLSQFDQAIADCDAVLRLEPNHPFIHSTRAYIRMKAGDYDGAIEDYSLQLQVTPDSEQVYLDRADAYRAKGDRDNEAADYAKILEIKPEFARGEWESGNSSANLGLYESALKSYGIAIRVDPRFAEALNSRAWLLATCPEAKYRDGKQAVADAQQACELTEWKEVEDVDTLAAAYAESGNFDEAVRWQEKAVELAPDDKKDQYRVNLKLFKSGMPFRQTR